MKIVSYVIYIHTHSQTYIHACTTIPLQIFTGLTVLRKLCNHPDLVINDYHNSVSDGNKEEEEEEKEEEETERVFIGSRRPERRRRRRRLSNRLSGSGGGREEREGGYNEEEYGWWKRSGKMIVVEALLKMWWAQKHNVLLFSQSKMVSIENSPSFMYCVHACMLRFTESLCPIV